MNRKSLFSLLVLVSLITAAFGFASPVLAANTTTLTIANVFHNQGDTFNVPLLINTSAALRGYQFDLKFDPSQVTVNSVSDGGFLSGCSTTNQPTTANGGIDNTSGVITAMNCAILGGTSHGTGAGTLAIINVTVKNTATNGKSFFTMPSSTIYPALYLDSGQVAQSDITTSLGFVGIGNLAKLAVDSITFNPASGTSNPQTTVTITVKNVGGAAMDATDVDTFTVTATTGTTPASWTFTVGNNTPSDLLAVGATESFTKAIDLGSLASSNINVTDTLFGVNSTVTYVGKVATAPQGVNVNANIVPVITLTTGGDINFGNLVLGANNSKTSTMNVLSNGQTWNVTATFDNKGYMSEWNSTNGYVSGGEELHDQLVLSESSTAGSSNTISGSSTGAAVTLIPDGVVAHQSEDSGENYTLTYAQTMHNSDAALATGNSYHMVITYTAVITF